MSKAYPHPHAQPLLPDAGKVELLFLLFHGAGADCSQMQPLAEALAAAYPQAAVVSLDAPTPLPSEAVRGYQWFDEADPVAGVAAALPEFIATAVRNWIAQKGFKTLFIEPGAPWQNCYSESFNARFRDEFLNVESFTSLLEAKVLGSEHRDKYNHHRPHSSLGDLTPAEFAAVCLNPSGCSQAPSASDEFRPHSRLPEPANNPRSSVLEQILQVSNPRTKRKSSPQPTNPKHHQRFS